VFDHVIIDDRLIMLRPAIARLILLGFLISMPIFTASAADDESPASVVTGFQTALIDVMKTAESLSVKQRYEQLAPTVDRSFHIALMAQISAGTHWQQATREERIDLVKAFRRMSISTLATLFSGYSGEVFKVNKEMDGPSQTRLIMTELIKQDKSTVDISYVCRRFQEGWRVIDVIVDNGISELKVRRSEYNLILKQSGLPGLITLLHSKADELVAE